MKFNGYKYLGLSLLVLASSAIASLAGNRAILIAESQRSQGEGTEGAEIRFGTIEIESPWLRETPQGAKVGAGYFKVENLGNEPDSLLGASSPAAESVEIHRSSMENGISQMRPVTKPLEILPDSKLIFKPGGLHLMLNDLKNPLRAGETYKIQLKFEKAGVVEVGFTVRAGSAAPMGAETHGSMQMHMH
jgi:copper(I)-binding protein